MGKVSKALDKAAATNEPGEPIESPPTMPRSHASPEQESQHIPPVESTSMAIKEVQLDEDRPQAATTHSPPQKVPARGEWDERLLTANEKFSGVAESFRKLRTMILHPEDGPPARTIMVASANPQEGKSFVTANLGISLAQGVGRRGLLIDCDLRRPSLHALFGLPNKQGLADYLRDGRDISTFMLPTGLANLTLFPAGPPPDNPSELIASDKMAGMIRALTDNVEGRVVVLDTPPCLVASETLILSQLVDKVVLVVRWGKSGRENVRKVIEQIGREKIIGIVFNAFEMNVLDKKIQGVGYHNYYSEAYY
ncbi:MAG: CpsD/CapB family tyrosine-protein kinase [Deltaproteobacteria bacterium]|nr:CpsD/CapB family tyrosine-protein kinase [Deltaproteobacteria bacterium]MCK9502505.1 CpsD/CapB family tyrosine-protein kinase [Lascolabacillus sp.]